MAEDKSELSSLQERLKAMRDKQRALEKDKDAAPEDTPPPAKPKPTPKTPDNKNKDNKSRENSTKDTPAAPSQGTDEAAARILERLKKVAAPEKNSEETGEKKQDENTPPPAEPESPPEAKPENPADRLRALLEKHRQEQQQRALEEEEEEAPAPPRPEPKPAPRLPEPQDLPPTFDPAPAPTFSAPRSSADLYQGYAAPAAPPVRTQPTLRYRLRLRSEKLKKTMAGRGILRLWALGMRLVVAASLVMLVGFSLAFMADRYCSINDLLQPYCQQGKAPPALCQRDFGMFDVSNGRNWEYLQSYYDSGFIIPWNYVYVMGGHLVAALVLGLMGLYHGPRVYRKILRFLTFPLRKVGLFKTL